MVENYYEKIDTLSLITLFLSMSIAVANFYFIVSSEVYYLFLFLFFKFIIHLIESVIIIDIWYDARSIRPKNVKQLTILSITYFILKLIGKFIGIFGGFYESLGFAIGDALDTVMIMFLLTYSIMIFAWKRRMNNERERVQIGEQREESQLVTSRASNLIQKTSILEIRKQDIFMEDDKECQICLEEYGDEKLGNLRCGHNFHMECLNKWFENKVYKCPLCRQSIITGRNRKLEYITIDIAGYYSAIEE